MLFIVYYEEPLFGKHIVHFKRIVFWFALIRNAVHEKGVKYEPSISQYPSECFVYSAASDVFQVSNLSGRIPESIPVS